MNGTTSSLLLSFVAFGFCVNMAHADDVNAHIKKYETVLGATRIIYDPSTKGSTLSVTNPQEYPVLIQAEVFDESKKPTDAFIVTPPVFRLDEKKTSKLSIFYTGNEPISDREAMSWLCVKSIPPKEGDAWAKNSPGVTETEVNLQLSLNNCIKLIRRPHSLQGDMESRASKITWAFAKDAVVAHNDSPFYMNLASVKVDGKEIKELKYIPPYSASSFSLPMLSGSGQSRHVDWQVINDFGGKSRVFSGVVE